MRIELTLHARKRCRERGISTRAIRAALLNPDRTESHAELIAVTACSNVGTLVVIFRAVQDRRVIITAYYITAYMKIEYDKNADAMYLRFTRAKIRKTTKVRGGFFIDLDGRGGVVGVEILNYARYIARKDQAIEIGGKKIPLLVPA